MRRPVALFLLQLGRAAFVRSLALLGETVNRARNSRNTLLSEGVRCRLGLRRELMKALLGTLVVDSCQ